MTKPRLGHLPMTAPASVNELSEVLKQAATRFLGDAELLWPMALVNANDLSKPFLSHTTVHDSCLVFCGITWRATTPAASSGVLSIFSYTGESPDDIITFFILSETWTNTQNPMLDLIPHPNHDSSTDKARIRCVITVSLQSQVPNIEVFLFLCFSKCLF